MNQDKKKRKDVSNDKVYGRGYRDFFEQKNATGSSEDYDTGYIEAFKTHKARADAILQKRKINKK
jgi:hypothetical protein